MNREVAIAMAQDSSLLLQPPVLLATDGSTTAKAAQELIIPVARHLMQDSQSSDAIASSASETAALVILHVQPKSSGRRGRGEAEAAPTESGQSSAEASSSSVPAFLAEIQAELLSQLDGDGHGISLQVVQGRPATEILNQARQLQAGLIAVGCHGTGGARELLLGSVSAELARYAESHVLIARSQPEDNPPASNWNHVLLVVTGAQATQGAIAMARQLLPIGIHRLTILCVQPPLNAHYLFGPFASPTPSWQLMQALHDAQREQSDRMIQQAEKAFEACSVEIQTLVDVGEPGPLICQVAQQQAANVILLGSDTTVAKRSREGPLHPPLRLPFRPLRLSSTADYVIHHAPCPVLLCRTKAAGASSASVVPSVTTAGTSQAEDE